jgi:hypothetical protein
LGTLNLVFKENIARKKEDVSLNTGNYGVGIDMLSGREGPDVDLLLLILILSSSSSSSSSLYVCTWPLAVLPTLYLLTYLLTYLLAPWSRVLLGKLTGLQLVKKFTAFY